MTYSWPTSRSPAEASPCGYDPEPPLFPASAVRRTKRAVAAGHVATFRVESCAQAPVATSVKVWPSELTAIEYRVIWPLS